jgi:hypothetical protein
MIVIMVMIVVIVVVVVVAVVGTLETTAEPAIAVLEIPRQNHHP